MTEQQVECESWEPGQRRAARHVGWRSGALPHGNRQASTPVRATSSVIEGRPASTWSGVEWACGDGHVRMIRPATVCDGPSTPLLAECGHARTWPRPRICSGPGHVRSSPSRGLPNSARSVDRQSPLLGEIVCVVPLDRIPALADHTHPWEVHEVLADLLGHHPAEIRVCVHPLP